MFKEVMINTLIYVAKILGTVAGLFSSVFFLGVLFGIFSKSKITAKPNEKNLQN